MSLSTPSSRHDSQNVCLHLMIRSSSVASLHFRQIASSSVSAAALYTLFFFSRIHIVKPGVVLASDRVIDGLSAVRRTIVENPCNCFRLSGNLHLFHFLLEGLKFLNTQDQLFVCEPRTFESLGNSLLSFVER